MTPLMRPIPITLPKEAIVGRTRHSERHPPTHHLNIDRRSFVAAVGFSPIPKGEDDNGRFRVRLTVVERGRKGSELDGVYYLSAHHHLTPDNSPRRREALEAQKSHDT